MAIEEIKSDEQLLQEALGRAEAFKPSNDLRTDFRAIISLEGQSMPYQAPTGIPQQMVNFAMQTIHDDEKLISESLPAWIDEASKTSGQEWKVSKYEAQRAFVTKRLELLKDFIKRHGGDVERAALGLQGE